uniref:Uncharacterized protein n=1 Tax=viral metagenome TaxID=1070528 RepID=A0A6C0D7K1_9ZZZZ
MAKKKGVDWKGGWNRFTSGVKKTAIAAGAGIRNAVDPCRSYKSQITEKNAIISDDNVIINGHVDSINRLQAENGSLRDNLKRCSDVNNKLINKNNVLLDTTQYLNDQISGIDGYQATVTKLKQEKDNILEQKISQPVIQVEGFSNEIQLDTYTYNKLNTENTIIQNQIDVNKNERSVDDRLYLNIYDRVQYLNGVNKILGWILFAIIIICGIAIWISSATMVHKLVMVKVVWLYLVFVEILEYILFYVIRYIRALLFGRPYNANDFWKFPHLTWIDIGVIILIVLSVFI